MLKYPNLYSDISSLTQLNKFGYLKEALTRPEFSGRLLYGSDFPLINTPLVSPWYYGLMLKPWRLLSVLKAENPWDRDVLLKQELGTPAEVFRRSGELIGGKAPSMDGRFTSTIIISGASFFTLRSASGASEASPATAME